jgi:hypothetical protein
MGPIEIQILLNTIFRFAITVVGAICLTTIIAMALRRRTPPAAIQSPDVLRRLDEISQSVARLDNAVEAVAVEVERISEGQRFTTRLLSEPSAARSLIERTNSSGSTTPH